jgi:hypothetical protein
MPALKLLPYLRSSLRGFEFDTAATLGPLAVGGRLWSRGIRVCDGDDGYRILAICNGSGTCTLIRHGWGEREELSVEYSTCDVGTRRVMLVYGRRECVGERESRETERQREE